MFRKLVDRRDVIESPVRPTTGRTNRVLEDADHATQILWGPVEIVQLVVDDTDELATGRHRKRIVRVAAAACASLLERELVNQAHSRTQPIAAEPTWLPRAVPPNCWADEGRRSCPRSSGGPG